MSYDWSTLKINYPSNWIDGSSDLNILVDGKPFSFWGIKELIWVLRDNDKFGLIEIHRYLEDNKTIIINEQVDNISINGNRYTIASDNTPEGTSIKIRDIDITNDVLGFMLIARAGYLIKLSIDII